MSLRQQLMKILKRIRDIYDERQPLYELLAQEAEEVLKPKAEEKGWFFLARVKEIESFALKIETGRVKEPACMEDFFACTIIVPTIAQIDQAERLVLSFYSRNSRRPPSKDMTHKTPSNFVFDDLRLYVARRPSASGRNLQLDNVVFEVQIKTILQYAWGVATHDLIYKSDTVSWPLERLSFQVKAMLEHAEIAISEAARLAEAPALAKKDKRTVGILRLIGHIRHIWPSESLPADIKRLAETMFELLRSCDLDVRRFPKIIEAEKRRLGILPTDLSPYAFTVQALAQSTAVDFRQKFERKRARTIIVIHDGMELPEWMSVQHPRIVNLG